MKDLARCRQGSSSQRRGPNASEPERIKLCQAKLKWQLEQRSRSDQLSHISQLPHRLSHQACRANLLTQMFGGARCRSYKRVPKFPFKGHPICWTPVIMLLETALTSRFSPPPPPPPTPAMVPGANLHLGLKYREKISIKFGKGHSVLGG